MGHFPTNFQYSLAEKLLIGSEKVRRSKNDTDLLYHHAKYGGDRGLRARCRRKSVLPAGLREAQPCRYCFYAVGLVQNRFFKNFTYIGAEMWEYSPKNYQNFEFWP